MRKPSRQPWHPAEWEDADANALKALAIGDALPHQQKRALDWIISKACMTYDEAFVPGQPDVTANIGGRQTAGRQIVKLVNIDLNALREKKGTKP